MNVTLYAKFLDAAQAEKALAAMIDRGADVKDLSAVFPGGFQNRDYDLTTAEQAVAGVSTTTEADAMAGAQKGAAVGLGLGALAAVTSLVIPGFGLVTGGGALVTALIAMSGATVGGAVAGSVAGYLQDQGVPTRLALDVEEARKNGCAIIAVRYPTGKLGEFEVMEIFSKYDADTFWKSPVEAGASVGFKQDTLLES